MQTIGLQLSPPLGSQSSQGSQGSHVLVIDKLIEHVTSENRSSIQAKRSKKSVFHLKSFMLNQGVYPRAPMEGFHMPNPTSFDRTSYRICLLVLQVCACAVRVRFETIESDVLPRSTIK